MDTLTALRTAFEQAIEVVEAVGPDQWGLSTPCPDYDVRTVVNHMVGSLLMVEDGLLGREFGDHEPTDDNLGTASPAEAFAVASKRVLALWSEPGRLDGTVRLSFGEFPAPLAALINVLETFVHAGDVAVATAHQGLVSEQFCDEVRSAIADAGFDAFRGPGWFGPEVEVDDDRPSLEALLAYTGREV